MSNLSHILLKIAFLKALIASLAKILIYVTIWTSKKANQRAYFAEKSLKFTSLAMNYSENASRQPV